ncbi:MAG: MBOAT family protein [Chloroflexi bacterium]|nr:MBOAT family protein [Chloroflexota bacterium]
MLFNSNDFLLFFGTFLLAYYLARRHLAARNLLIVIASYIFYGWWDYRFVGLLLFTSVLDFAVALGLDRFRKPSGRRALLAGSMVANLSVLFLFKYFDFFQGSLATLLAHFGHETHWRALHWVLPVGISFYTFQSMSYVIDVYRRRTPASADPVAFLAYVSFFPQLVAGPIERATNLLLQMTRTLRVTRAGLEQGLWLILWGMFKKVVLADNLAPLVELVFQLSTPTGPMVLLGTVAFALQIYCDFSGYSDIARGAAKVLGFDLMLNFNLPYSATSVRDFWRRWHISLSTWLRDYLYVSLGGNRRTPFRTYLNLLVTMLLGGLWHGAALNFVLWGIWHGAGLMLNRWWEERHRGRWSLPVWVAWPLTMLFVLYGWMLFRAGSPDQVVAFTQALGVFSVPAWWKPYVMNLALLAGPLVLMQLWQHRTGNAHVVLRLPLWQKGLLQGALFYGTMIFWKREAAPFIYFQF